MCYKTKAVVLGLSAASRSQTARYVDRDRSRCRARYGTFSLRFLADAWLADTQLATSIVLMCS